jgi:hypothetical protein
MVKGAYRMLAALVLAAGVLLVSQPAGATAANDKAAAVKALKRQIAYASDGQYDRLYSELHPAQQALVTQACYIDQLRDLQGASIEVKDVKKVYRTTLAIPGTGDTARGYGVTVKVKIASGGRSETATTTRYEFKVGGHWKFSVPQMTIDQCNTS